MDTPLVSITSACYNTGQVVLDMVKSVLRQTYSNWELILLDDCSTDETYDILMSIDDPRVKVFKNEKNLGIPASLNRLTSLSNGEYIARMDSDDMSTCDRISKQVEFMNYHPNVDVVGCGIFYLGENDQPVGKGAIHTDHNNICKKPSCGIGLAHPTILAKRSWFETFKYNEKIARTSDYNLMLRAHKKSVYANLPEHLFYYRLGFSFNLKKEFMSRHCMWQSVKDYYLPLKRYDVIGKSFLISYLKFIYEVFHVLAKDKDGAYKHRSRALTDEERLGILDEIQEIVNYNISLK